MSEERGAAGRSRVPNHIPAHILRNHEDSARCQVTAERIYIETVRTRQRWWRRLPAQGAKAAGQWWPLPVWLVAAAATGVWLVLDPASTVAFSMAFFVSALSTVAAIVSSIAVAGRRIGKRLRR